jgi:hypothetical protein
MACWKSAVEMITASVAARVVELVVVAEARAPLPVTR